MSGDDTARLEVALFQQGLRFIHFSANKKLALAARARFNNAMLNAGISTPSPVYHEAVFIACELQGVGLEHVPVVIFEDWDTLDHKAREEALLIPYADPGHDTMIIKSTSREL